MTDNTMTLIQQLRGRAAFLRDIGRVKSPQLMEQAADAITRHLSQTAETSVVPVAWMIEWDSEDDGHKCCPRKGQDKPRLDCFPEGTTAYPLFATPQQASAVPDGFVPNCS